MLKMMRNLMAVMLLLFTVGLFNLDFNRVSAQNPNATIICVYASWSVTTRDVLPAVENIAGSFKIPLKELDIDSAETATELEKFNLSTPDRTPYVAVIRQGKVVFQKAYPNGTPDQVKKDLSNLITTFY